MHHSASMSELQFDIASFYSQVYNLILQRFEKPFIRDYKNESKALTWCNCDRPHNVKMLYITQRVILML